MRPLSQSRTLCRAPNRVAAVSLPAASRSSFPSNNELTRPSTQCPLSRQRFATSAVAMSSAKLNEACCSIPPVQTSYQPKGSFEEIAGIKSYVIGDKSAKEVLINVYDIFGMSSLPRSYCALGLMLEPFRLVAVSPIRDVTREAPE
jgi:hypothetical protein